VRKDLREIAYYFKTQPQKQVTQIQRDLILNAIAAMCGIDANFMKEAQYNEDFTNKYLLDENMLYLLDEMARIINAAYNLILGKTRDERVTALLTEMKIGIDVDQRLHRINNIVLRERARAFSEYSRYLPSH
jgi:hypothetical protein